jgi:catechol 2,3-dioxygenase-like lactoylglutathione lyase family enzyme
MTDPPEARGPTPRSRHEQAPCPSTGRGLPARKALLASAGNEFHACSIEARGLLAMMYILGLDHVVLRVADVSRMTRFYCEVLGCEVERRVEHIGLVQLRAGQSLIDLLPKEGPAAAPGAPEAANEASAANGRNLDHFCLRVEPFDESAIVAHLINHGVVPGETRRRYGADGYGSSIYIRDPEGNTVELKGPPG